MSVRNLAVNWMGPGRHHTPGHGALGSPGSKRTRRVSRSSLAGRGGGAVPRWGVGTASRACWTARMGVHRTDWDRPPAFLSFQKYKVKLVPYPDRSPDPVPHCGGNYYLPRPGGGGAGTGVTAASPAACTAFYCLWRSRELCPVPRPQEDPDSHGQAGTAAPRGRCPLRLPSSSHHEPGEHFLNGCGTRTSGASRRS